MLKAQQGITCRIKNYNIDNVLIHIAELSHTFFTNIKQWLIYYNALLQQI